MDNPPGNGKNRGTKRSVPSSSDEEKEPPMEAEVVGASCTPLDPHATSDSSPKPPAEEGYVNHLDDGQFNELLTEIYENAAEQHQNKQEEDEDEDNPTKSLIAWIIQDRKEQKERIKERVRQNKLVLEKIERDWRARAKIPKERKNLIYEMNKTETKDLIRRLTAEMGKWERVHFRTRMSSVIPEKPGKPYVYPVKIFFEDLNRIKEELEETDSSDCDDIIKVELKEDSKDKSPPRPEGSVPY